MYDANIMKKSSRFYLKYNPDNRWSFWTGKWWSLCSEISGQFTPKLGGQFDRLFQMRLNQIKQQILFWLEVVLKIFLGKYNLKKEKLAF